MFWRNPFVFGAAILVIGLLVFFSVFQSHSRVPQRKIAFIGFVETDEKILKNRPKDAPGYVWGDSLKFLCLQQAIASKSDAYTIQSHWHDRRDTTNIVKIYERIAADKDVALVVDNGWGRHLMQCTTIIKTNQLPVISLSADRNLGFADYQNNVVFLQPSDDWPKYIVKFIKKAPLTTRSETVGFVSEYDYKLDVIYRNGFSSDSLPFADVFSKFSQDRKNKLTRADTVALFDALQGFDGSTLVFNLHAHNLDVIKEFLKNKKFHPNVRNVLGLTLSNVDLRKLALKHPDVKFFRLVMGEEMFSHDMLTSFEQHSKQYETVFEKDGDASRGHFRNITEATNLIAGLLDAVKIKEDTFLQRIHGSRQYFSRLFQRKDTLEAFGNRQLFRFDKSQILLKTPTFEYYKGDSIRINPYQINNDGKRIPNLHVVLDPVKIKDLDAKKNTFTCNFKYWIAVPKGDSVYKKAGYVNFNLARTDETNIDLISTTDFNELTISVYEVGGELFHKFKTIEFPFDTQEIYLPISALGPSDEIRISFDPSRIEAQMPISKNELHVNGWRWADEHYTYASLDNQYVYEYGSLNRLENGLLGKKEEYKTLGIWLRVARVRWGAYLMIVIPLFFLGLIPCVMLMARDEKFGKLQEQIIGVMLAIVAFSYNIVQISPDNDNINRAYIMLAVALISNLGCLFFANLLGKKFDNLLDHPGWMLRFRYYFPYVWLVAFIVCFLLIIPNSWGLYWHI